MTVDLATAFVADLNIERRASTSPSVEALRQGSEPHPRVGTRVYTAFDGDHFAMVPVMRRHVLMHHRTPLNPESVVGYKDSVDAYHSKLGVLRADIAVVAKCDAIWIYSERVRVSSDLHRLAEGVLLELLWYLRTREEA